MTLFNPGWVPKIHSKYGKRFKKCVCGDFFVSDGCGKRKYCDDCRAKNKVKYTELNALRQKLKGKKKHEKI